MNQLTQQISEIGLTNIEYIKNENKKTNNDFEQLLNRYYLHSKEVQKLKQYKKCVQNVSFGPLQKIIRKLWQTIVPVCIRGECNQNEELYKHCKQKLTDNKQHKAIIEKIKQILSIFSNQPKLQDIFKNAKKCICIFYTKENAMNIITSLAEQKLFNKLKQLHDSKTILYLKSFTHKQLFTNVWIQSMGQLYQNMECQIYQNKQSYNEYIIEDKIQYMQTKQSVRCLKKMKQQIKDPKNKINFSNLNIQFPFLVPLWKGLFNQIIMLTPILLKDYEHIEFQCLFKQRQQLENAVQNAVQLKIQKFKKNREEKRKIDQQQKTMDKYKLNRNQKVTKLKKLRKTKPKAESMHRIKFEQKQSH